MDLLLKDCVMEHVRLVDPLLVRNGTLLIGLAYLLEQLFAHIWVDKAVHPG